MGCGAEARLAAEQKEKAQLQSALDRAREQASHVAEVRRLELAAKLTLVEAHRERDLHAAQAALDRERAARRVGGWRCWDARQVVRSGLGEQREEGTRHQRHADVPRDLSRLCHGNTPFLERAQSRSFTAV